MSVDEDSSSSEEGEKDSSSDSSCSDSESNDENKKDDQPAAVSPPRQEEEQPSWYLKNFLKRSTPDTNNTIRVSQQVREKHAAAVCYTRLLYSYVVFINVRLNNILEYYLLFFTLFF